MDAKSAERSSLGKSGSIEVVQEDLHERGTVQIGEFGNLTNDANVAEFFDSFTVLAVLIANQHYAVNGQLRRVQRRQSQERVIDGANSAARRQNHGQLKLHHQVQHKLLAVNRHQHAARAFNNEPIVQQARRCVDPPQIDFDAGPTCSQVRRDRRHKFVHLFERTIGPNACQAHHRYTVRTLQGASLYRFPVHRVQRSTEQRRQRGFSNSRICAGDKEVASHAYLVVNRGAFASRHATNTFTSRARSSSAIRAVSDRRRRARPSGTVGGRMARTANPSRCNCSAACTVSSLLPNITGTIWLALPPVSNPARPSAVFSASARFSNVCRSISIPIARFKAALICSAK